MCRSVEDVVKRLKRGDEIIVCWLDAAEYELPSSEIPTPLPNHCVETRQEERGEFICVQKGRFSGEPFLIYVLKRLDDKPRLTSVPLSIVYRIVVLEKKFPRKTIKLESYIQKSFRKRIQHFSDGVVKYYRLRWKEV